MNRLLDLLFDGRRLLVLTALVIVASVAASFLVMGTPAHQRDLRMDEARVRDLERLQSALREWHREHGDLPPTLAALAAQPGLALDISDPLTGVAYGYRRDGSRRFELCAEFSTDSGERGSRNGAPGISQEQWRHGSGRTCYWREASEPKPGEA